MKMNGKKKTLKADQEVIIMDSAELTPGLLATR